MFTKLKTYNLKLITTLISAIFIINNICYGIDLPAGQAGLPKRAYLRGNSLFDGVAITNKGGNLVISEDANKQEEGRIKAVLNATGAEQGTENNTAVVKNIQENKSTGAGNRNRDEFGRFANEEGKSAEDMVKILSGSEYKERPFTVDEYCKLWRDEFDKDLLSRTAYKDLEDAIKKGYIRKAEEYAHYELTGRINLIYEASELFDAGKHAYSYETVIEGLIVGSKITDIQKAIAVLNSLRQYYSINKDMDKKAIIDASLNAILKHIGTGSHIKDQDSIRKELRKLHKLPPNVIYPFESSCRRELERRSIMGWPNNYKALKEGWYKDNPLLEAVKKFKIELPKAPLGKYPTKELAEKEIDRRRKLRIPNNREALRVGPYRDRGLLNACDKFGILLPSRIKYAYPEYAKEELKRREKDGWNNTAYVLRFGELGIFEFKGLDRKLTDLEKENLKQDLISNGYINEKSNRITDKALVLKKKDTLSLTNNYNGLEKEILDALIYCTHRDIDLHDVCLKDYGIQLPLKPKTNKALAVNSCEEIITNLNKVKDPDQICSIIEKLFRQENLSLKISRNGLGRVQIIENVYNSVIVDRVFDSLPQPNVLKCSRENIKQEKYLKDYMIPLMNIWMLAHPYIRNTASKVKVSLASSSEVENWSRTNLKKEVFYSLNPDASLKRDENLPADKSYDIIIEAPVYKIRNKNNTLYITSIRINGTHVVFDDIKGNIPNFDSNEVNKIKDAYKGINTSESAENSKMFANGYKIKELLGKNGVPAKTDEELAEMVRSGNIFAFVALDIKGAEFTIKKTMQKFDQLSFAAGSESEADSKIEKIIREIYDFKNNHPVKLKETDIAKLKEVFLNIIELIAESEDYLGNIKMVHSITKKLSEEKAVKNGNNGFIKDLAKINNILSGSGYTKDQEGLKKTLKQFLASKMSYDKPEALPQESTVATEEVKVDKTPEPEINFDFNPDIKGFPPSYKLSIKDRIKSIAAKLNNRESLEGIPLIYKFPRPINIQLSGRFIPIKAVEIKLSSGLQEDEAYFEIEPNNRGYLEPVHNIPSRVNGYTYSAAKKEYNIIKQAFDEGMNISVPLGNGNLGNEERGFVLFGVLGSSYKHLSINDYLKTMKESIDKKSISESKALEIIDPFFTKWGEMVRDIHDRGFVKLRAQAKVFFVENNNINLYELDNCDIKKELSEEKAFLLQAMDLFNGILTVSDVLVKNGLLDFMDAKGKNPYLNFLRGYFSKEFEEYEKHSREDLGILINDIEVASDALMDSLKTTELKGDFYNTSTEAIEVLFYPLSYILSRENIEAPCSPEGFGENIRKLPGKIHIFKMLKMLKFALVSLPLSMQEEINKLDILKHSDDLISELEEAGDLSLPLSADNNAVQALNNGLKKITWNQEALDNENIYDWWMLYSNVWTNAYDLLQIDVANKELWINTAYRDVFKEIYMGLFTGLSKVGEDKLAIQNELKRAQEELDLYAPIKFGVQRLSDGMKLTKEDELKLYHLIERCVVRILADQSNDDYEIINEELKKISQEANFLEKPLTVEDVARVVYMLIEAPYKLIPYNIYVKELKDGLECIVVEPDIPNSNVIFLHDKKKDEFIMMDGGPKIFKEGLKEWVFPKIGIKDPARQIKSVILTHGQLDYLGGGLEIAKDYGIYFRAKTNAIRAEESHEKGFDLQRVVLGHFLLMALGYQGFDATVMDNFFRPYPEEKESEITIGGTTFDVIYTHEIGGAFWAVVRLGEEGSNSIALAGPLNDKREIYKDCSLNIITGDINMIKDGPSLNDSLKDDILPIGVELLKEGFTQIVGLSDEEILQKKIKEAVAKGAELNAKGVEIVYENRIPKALHIKCDVPISENTALETEGDVPYENIPEWRLNNIKKYLLTELKVVPYIENGNIKFSICKTVMDELAEAFKNKKEVCIEVEAIKGLTVFVNYKNSGEIIEGTMSTRKLSNEVLNFNTISNFQKEEWKGVKIDALVESFTTNGPIFEFVRMRDDLFVRIDKLKKSVKEGIKNSTAYDVSIKELKEISADLHKIEIRSMEISEFNEKWDIPKVSLLTEENAFKALQIAYDILDEAGVEYTYPKKEKPKPVHKKIEEVGKVAMPKKKNTKKEENIKTEKIVLEPEQLESYTKEVIDLTIPRFKVIGKIDLEPVSGKNENRSTAYEKTLSGNGNIRKDFSQESPEDIEKALDILIENETILSAVVNKTVMWRGDIGFGITVPINVPGIGIVYRKGVIPPEEIPYLIKGHSSDFVEKGTCSVIAYKDKYGNKKYSILRVTHKENIGLLNELEGKKGIPVKFLGISSNIKGGGVYGLTVLYKGEIECLIHKDDISKEALDVDTVRKEEIEKHINSTIYVDFVEFSSKKYGRPHLKLVKFGDKEKTIYRSAKTPGDPTLVIKVNDAENPNRTTETKPVENNTAEINFIANPNFGADEETESLAPANKILASYEKDMADLHNIQQNGLSALSPEAKEVLFNPETAEWGKNFTPKAYYELYNLLIFPAYKSDFSFINNNMQLFGLDPNIVYSEKELSRVSLKIISHIIQISALKELEKGGLSREDLTILKKQFSNFEKEALSHGEDILSLGKSNSLKEPMYAYCDVVHNMHVSSKKWCIERKQFFEGVQNIGNGDENPFLNLLIYDIKNSLVINLRKQAMWSEYVSKAGYQILNGNVDDAITTLQDPLLDFDYTYASKEKMRKAYAAKDPKSFDPEAIDIILDKLVWLKENNVEGAEAVIKALMITSNDLGNFPRYTGSGDTYIHKLLYSEIPSLIKDKKYEEARAILEPLLEDLKAAAKGKMSMDDFNDKYRAKDTEPDLLREDVKLAIKDTESVLVKLKSQKLEPVYKNLYLEGLDINSIDKTSETKPSENNTAETEVIANPNREADEKTKSLAPAQENQEPVNLGSLQNIPIFFQEEQIRQNKEGFKAALGKIDGTNHVIILVKDAPSKEAFKEFAKENNIDISGNNIYIETYNEAKINEDKVSSYLTPILGIENLKCIAFDFKEDKSSEYLVRSMSEMATITKKLIRSFHEKVTPLLCEIDEKIVGSYLTHISTDQIHELYFILTKSNPMDLEKIEAAEYLFQYYLENLTVFSNKDSLRGRLKLLLKTPGIEEDVKKELEAFINNEESLVRVADRLREHLKDAENLYEKFNTIMPYFKIRCKGLSRDNAAKILTDMDIDYAVLMAGEGAFAIDTFIETIEAILEKRKFNSIIVMPGSKFKMDILNERLGYEKMKEFKEKGVKFIELYYMIMAEINKENFAGLKHLSDKIERQEGVIKINSLSLLNINDKVDQDRSLRNLLDQASKELVDLEILQNIPIFFLDKDIIANPESFKKAFRRIDASNKVTILVDDDFARNDFIAFARENDLDEIYKDNVYIDTFEEAKIQKDNVNSYLTPILDLEGLNCIPLTEDMLKKYPELVDA